MYHFAMTSAPALTSYLLDNWTTGEGPTEPLRDASTGEVIATLAVDGVDYGAAVAHARTVGVDELTALTFHDRATVLRNIGKLLLSDEVKGDLYALSSATGATKGDSWIDVDGGAGALMALASKARKELPNAKVAIDGPPEMLSRDGSFIGVHIMTPRRGIEVQINAFNFPIWGMLEKFGSAFLAGVPTIVKPAPQTAYLAHAAAAVIVDSGLVPPGSLQLACAAPGDLLDHLDGQDSVAFTGSAATAVHLRRHPVLTERSVHFNAELDSLNAAILAPSAGPDTAEFDLFVAEVAKEVTTKAGQKCTAIRRAIVPEALVGPVTEALEAKLADVVTGDPRSPEVTMGALVSTEQRDAVLAAIETLKGAADVVISGGDLVADNPGAGAFVTPTVLRASDTGAAVLHEVEAFGPVTTVMGYGDQADAVQLVARGSGSLVASVFGGDADENAALTLGIAAHHGRVLVVDASVGKTSTGHGSPLPQLLHGGPGRAGGGRELGGIRSVRQHLQTTAIQGSPAALTRITGEQMPGGPTSQDKGHPFRLHYDELAVGDSYTSDTRTVTLADIEAFAESTGDTFYAHTDEEAAKRSPIFGGIVAHGYLVLSFAAGLFVSPEEGPVLANYGIDRLRFATPTRPGDEIHVILTCKRKTRMAGRGYGEVAWDTQVINQDGEVAAAYDVLTMVADLPGVNGAPE